MKIGLRVSDHGLHKPVYTVTEDGKSLKVWIEEVEGLYYLCSKNKGADQLCGYPTADLRLCFRIMQKAGFLMTWLI